MECDEARRLEDLLPSLYKSEGGRTRGWTLSGLEPMIKPRCASGADLKELQRAKAPFDWTLEDKGSAAFLDFICVAQQIRVALWYPSTKTIVIYPAADECRSLSEKKPLFHVEEGGVPKEMDMEGKAFLDYADSNGWSITPPPSVLKSLGHLTVPELESVSQRLGMHIMSPMSPPEGGKRSKQDHVKAIGAFKVRQRLTESLSASRP